MLSTARFRLSLKPALVLATLILSTALVGTSIRPAEAHTTRIVWEVLDEDSVVFYAGHYHSSTALSGALLLNDVPYNFQAVVSNATFLTLTPAGGWDGSVGSNDPVPLNWQRVTIHGLVTGRYTLTTTQTGAGWPQNPNGFLINLVFEAPNQPPEPVIVAAPGAVVDEGDSITLDGSSSTDDGSIASYEWSVDDNAAPAGTDSTFTLQALDGPATHTVTLTVTDDQGESASTSTSITVQNVAPVVVAGPLEQTTLTGLNAEFAGSFTDPASDDSPFTIVWDFGDGGTASDALDAGHVYLTAGVHTVTLNVTEKDGGVGSASVQVTVLSPSQATDMLIETIGDMDLKQGTAKSLAAPLGGIGKLLEDGNPNNDAAACGKLTAFLNQVNALAGKSQLSDEQAAELRAEAESILESLGC
jgi:PKD repeat protein